MKQLIRISIFLLLPLCSFSAPYGSKQGKYTREKKMHQEFKVNSDALLKIDSEYGNISINTWEKDEMLVDIVIRANGNDEKEVLQRLEETSVQLEVNENMVNIYSVVESRKKKSWNITIGSFTIGSSGGSASNIEIIYQIKMPIKNRLNIHNSYGDIVLTRLKGPCSIDCEYGNLNIGELLNTDNRIELEYASKSNIDFIKEGLIMADYTSLHIEEADKIELKTDYSHISSEYIKQLGYTCNYGSLKVKKVDYLKGNGDYILVTFDNIAHEAYISADYGSVKIRHLEKGFRKIDIRSDYAGIKIGASEDNAFVLRAKLEYSVLKNSEDYSFPKRIKDNFEAYYEGFYREKNTNSLITINSDYGSISLR